MKQLTVKEEEILGFFWEKALPLFIYQSEDYTTIPNLIIIHFLQLHER